MSDVITLKDILAPSFYRPYNDFITGRKSTLCFAGGRGCVDGDTLLETPRGRVKVRDFKGGSVYSFDGETVVETFACSSIKYTRERLYRILFENGSEITVTDEHRFLTPSGWEMTKALSVSDVVLIQKYGNYLDDSRSSLSCASPSQDPSTEHLLVQKASYGSRARHCAEYLSGSHGDVLHSMRKLLGCLYHYWHDFRLCDGQLPTEEENYRDVLQRLADAPLHSQDGLHEDGLGVLGNDTRISQCEHRLSRQDCQSLTEDRCYGYEGSQIARMLFELLSEICPSVLKSQMIEDPACSIQRVAERLLCSIDNLDSSRSSFDKHGGVLLCAKDNVRESDNLRMLSDMLQRRVHDESLSDSLSIDEDVLNRNPLLTKCAVKSISEIKEDYYYDLFVPFYNNYITEGGIINHNSCKSSAISIFILLEMERNRRTALQMKARGDANWRSMLTHAICIRKVANTLADSVYAQFQWAVEKLRLSDKYIFLKTPLMIKRRGTDQRIMFRGLDDPARLKSIRCPMSFFSSFWAEELAEYDCMEEILDVQRSVQRGGHDFKTFFSYNPPETSANWVNYKIAEIAREDPTFGFYKSDYRSVPRDWLCDKFFRDAEILRRINERAYRHHYLGEITGCGTEVFRNVRDVRLSNEEISKFDLIRWGCDFGLRDPTVLIPVYYNRVTHSIVIFDEIYKSDMGLDDMEKEFKYMHDVKYKSYEYIVADYAGAQLILTLRQRGVQIIPCTKGSGSIEAGIKWLQSLTSIDIDSRRCPNVWHEFSLYEYAKNKVGECTGMLPDVLNHTIDGVRYACERLIKTTSMFG